ncbi:MAG: glycosyltransferase [Bacteroidaceae bacterium]|nr:glycosyltransferase [Bacteroidaceae bacterium]
MRILYVGNSLSNHMVRWTNAMIERGHEVMLVSDCRRGDIRTAKSKELKERYMRFGGKRGYFLNVFELRRIFREFKPDVVNVHFASGYGTLARLARLKPMVLSCYGSDIFVYPYRGRINRNILCRNLRYATAVASTSVAMATEARKVLGDDSFPITVTPFGVDVARFCPADRHVTNERPVIGIVKYLEKIYDIPLLLRAFAIVYERSEVKPVLDIYGNGPLKDELEALAAELGISDSVTFHGVIANDSLPEVLQKMDVFVNCSVKESFGVALVEAMACGIPVVATDTVGFREVVADAETGYVLKDRDPETMAQALLKLLSDKDLRERMGAAGRKRVLENYDWEQNVTTMENLFKKVSVLK